MRTGAHAYRLILSMVAIALLAIGALAQEQVKQPERPSIRVTGEVTITAKPDQAQVDIGVVSQAQSAEAAAANNSEQSNRVLEALHKALGPSADIKTISYSLTPNYRYSRDATPSIMGYTATNVVQVKTDKLTEVGKVVDAATQAGANNINSIQFTLKDERGVQAQALREAAAKARAKADVLAGALGVKIARVLFMEEGTPEIRPIRQTFVPARAAVAAAAPTPIEAGTIDVHATVTLTVEISQ